MRHRIFVVMILAGLIWVGSGLQKPEKASAAPYQSAAEMLELINQFRVSNGLAPFQYNSALSFAAQRHANWMAATGIFSHTGEGGSTPLSRAADAGFVGWVSENIVGGTNMSARQGLIWWQNSPVHYNTLVSTRHTQAGTGFAVSGNGQNMYVLVVGQPTNSEAAPPSADTSAAPLIITPIQLAEPREDGSIVHIIRPGQSLWMVAAYYDADLDYLYLINGLSENDFVQPGDEVYVRLGEGQPPPPTPTPRLTYLVQEGDSAWLIAARHGVELDFFLALNGITEETVLQPGSEVRVHLAAGESPPPTPTPPITYIVRAGDSLWSIAAKHNLTMAELLSWNGLAENALIRPGDELTIRQVLATETPTAVPVTATPGLEPAAGESFQAEASPSPTPTPTGQSGLAPETLAASSLAMARSQQPAEQPESGGPSGILIMAISLIVLAGVMLFIANRV